MAERRYETLVLVDADQGEAGCKELAARVRALMEGQGCPITQVQEWGLRDLAYTVGKQDRGFYLLYEYRAEPKALAEIERNLRLIDAVLRFVSVQQPENAPPASLKVARRPDRGEGDGDADGAEGGETFEPAEEGEGA